MSKDSKKAMDTVASSGKANFLLSKGDEYSSQGNHKKSAFYYMEYITRKGAEAEVLLKLINSLSIQGKLVETLDVYLLLAAKYPQRVAKSEFVHLWRKLPNFLEKHPNKHQAILHSLHRLYEITENPHVLAGLSDVHRITSNDESDKFINLNSLASARNAALAKSFVFKTASKNDYIGTRLPDFLVVGSQKTATTALYSYIVNHPSIYPSLRKELFFFSNDSLYSCGLDFYKSFFPDFKEQKYLTGEASATYFSDIKVPERISQALPDVKLIFTFRNPVRRAISDYFMKRKTGNERRSMSDAIMSELTLLQKTFAEDCSKESIERCRQMTKGYVVNGIYSLFFESYLDHFDKNMCLVVTAEQMKANPENVMKEVFDFLQIDNFHQGFPLVNVGSYSLDQSEYEKVHQELSEFYQPFNARLEALTGLRLNWG